MNPYEVLGVSRDADEKEISKVYRKLSRKYHPDMHGGDNVEENVRRFKEISAAYEILSSPEKRRQYDQFGTADIPNRAPFNPFGSFFDSIFGAHHNPVPQGEHVVVQCQLDLHEVLTGATKELKYTTKEKCPHCNGNKTTCPNCQGSGKRMVHGNNVVVQITCESCRGEGTHHQSCDRCNHGLVDGPPKIISFEAPQGVESGMRFAYRGLGFPSTHPEGAPGNLYVVVNVSPHDFLQRDGRFLQCEIEISYTQLVLGAEIDVPTLEGSAKLKVPAGTKPSDKFKLTGMGVPGFNNRRGVYKRGDQFVQIKLKVPKNLTPEHKQLIEQLATLEKGEVDGRASQE